MSLKELEEKVKGRAQLSLPLRERKALLSAYLKALWDSDRSPHMKALLTRYPAIELAHVKEALDKELSDKVSKIFRDAGAWQ